MYTIKIHTMCICIYVYYFLVICIYTLYTRHGPILGKTFYDIFRMGLEYTRMLKMYHYK